jgi:cell wall-associated NlpC family hydrolase
MGLVGTPYRYGGNTPESGFDCSGLIGHVYRTRAAITPPRTVAKLSEWGFSIPREDLQSGDLVLFTQNYGVAHAGIYVGGNRFVHAPSTGGVVRLDSLNSKYWAAQQVTFRRP